MPRIVRNTLQQYLPGKYFVEKNINPARIFDFNNMPVKDGNIVYLCERELRVRDNFALNFAIENSKKLKMPLKIVYEKKYFDFKPKGDFLNKLIEETKDNFLKHGLDFEIIENVQTYLKNNSPAMLIIDFNPISDKNFLKNAPFKIYEIDGHNIIPARFVSDKREYNAATLRRKIYSKIHDFLTEFDNFSQKMTEADYVLKDFTKNKLSYYAEFKNNPNKDVVSGLSTYLNLGFISSQSVALEVIRADVPDISKETFLEELIIRKELADNFCLYCKDFKSFDCIPDWAKNSLNVHKYDVREYLYKSEELENAKTHDKLWNACQIQLKREGKIHGYMRMYWAKKIAERTISPEQALKFAIYLNDKYAFDAPSSNGYENILQSIGGLHDRAFRDTFVTGKIRRMTFNSLKRKFDTSEYIEKYSE